MKVIFDTLAYASKLKDGGVDRSEIHAASLSEVIGYNVYTKGEIEKMFDAALKRFDERTQEMKAESAQALQKHEAEMLKIQLHLERTIHRSVYTTIAILGSLIVVVGVIASFAHYFFH